mgnify:CR=1 FL=1|jgi:chromosomal replication initiation ATPase DnaA
MNDQLILDFPVIKNYLKEDFYVSSSNKEAYDFIVSWPKWLKRIANIFGPPGSGKSHISSILKKKISFLEIESTSLDDKIFNRFKTKELLIIKNIDESISEEILFSLWNVALHDNKYFLITSVRPVNQYNFKLEDLKSRVNSCMNIGIKLPSDELIKVILSKRLSDKQIKIDKKHLDFAIKRIDRSYEKISQFVSILDKYSLKRASPPNLKLIKEVLKMI